MKYRIPLVLLLLFGALYGFPKVPIIAHDNAATGPSLLAVKELQRYLYVRTGEMPQIRIVPTANALPPNSIFVTTTGNSQLSDQSFQLRSVPGHRLLIIGGSPIATLYGVYKFLESTGIGFDLDEDIIPEEKLTTIELAGFDKIYKPVFELRGIQPFHDFPEGPDWWNEDDYKAIITQLPKMGMNFIGFHTYPSVNVFRGWYKPEPLVWIGTGQQFDKVTGRVSAAYPALHANTNDSTWNYYPKKTTEFNFGAAQLFETTNFGADYMKNRSAWPHTPEENIDIFNEVGVLLNHCFSLARDLGVKTCIGTETPITFPAEVRQALLAQDKNMGLGQARQEAYEAMFARIEATHPLNYYWLWTSEDWTWSGERPGEADAVKADLLGAIAAAKKVKAPFTLATCGWVLGPSRNRAEFDQLLPKDMPFGVINRQQGYAPVEPAFANVQGRPKWEISWMEDDPALICPQLWAGRTRKDAIDAYKYGCTGLIGIHWRTKGLSPSFMALSKAGWEADTYTASVSADQRDYPMNDLYDEWAKLQFGALAGPQASAVFQKLDGASSVAPDVTEYTAHFPRGSVWGEKGPGLIIANKRSWAEVEPEYNFIAEFEKCDSLIKEDGQKERFTYWLETFYYAKALAKTGCFLGQMDTLAWQIIHTPDTSLRKKLAGQLLVVRNETADAWCEMVTHLLQTVSTTGEMGTIANLEQHNMQQMRYLVRYDSLLSASSGELVQPVQLTKEYKGQSRLILTTKRTLLHPGEDLNFRVRVLSSDKISDVSIFWKSLGSDTTFKQKQIECEAANVYKLNLPANSFQSQSMEYYIIAKLASGQTIKYPAGKNTTQTLVVW